MKQQSLLTYFRCNSDIEPRNCSFIIGENEPLKKKNSANFFKQAPRHKIIQEGPFAVDAFKYEAIPNISIYFLTHFHSDHYEGLTKTWNKGIIYCSPVTSALLREHLGISPKNIKSIPLNEPFLIPNHNCSVSFHDANHCPGAVMIVFDFYKLNIKILHTGDFRYDSTLASFRNVLETPFIRIYFDNTYCNPVYKFPTQHQSIIQAIREIETLVASKRTLLLVGSYLIGKERVFLELARHFSSKIYAQKSKSKILRLLQIDSMELLLTESPELAQIHIVSMQMLNWKSINPYMAKYWPHFEQVIAVIPTGWNFSQKKKKPSHFYPPTGERVLNSIHYVQIPYSEHSSCEELKNFIIQAKSEWFIGTSSGSLYGKKVHRKSLLLSL